MLGRFVELAVPCTSPLESLEFYCRLGFRPAPDTGHEETHHVVVGDGRLAIGLREGINRPTLVFAREDLQRHLDALIQAGVSVDTATIGDGAFNRLEGLLPNGIGLSLIEALTHSPQAYTRTSIGWFSEISFVRTSVDIDAWQSLGLIALNQIGDILPRIAVISDSLNLGFHPRPEFGEFWLSFESDDLRSCAEELERLGIEYVVADPSGGFARLAVTAPEGTRLVIHDSL